MKLIILLAINIALIIPAQKVYAQTANYTNDSLTFTTIKVKGITCSNDLKMITDNVEKLNGVNSCKTTKQGPTSTFMIYYNKYWVTEKELIDAIENTTGCENPDEKPYKVKK